MTIHSKPKCATHKFICDNGDIVYYKKFGDKLCWWNDNEYQETPIWIILGIPDLEYRLVEL